MLLSRGLASVAWLASAMLLPFLLSGNVVVVTAQEQDGGPPTCEEMLQSRLDCYDTDGPCDPLPIPATSFGVDFPDPVKGYFINSLRENVYYVGEGAYLAMVMVVPPPPSQLNGVRGRRQERRRAEGHEEIPLNPDIKQHCTPDDLCEQCQGDCQTDADCVGDLVCFQKTREVTQVPGCVGTSTSRTDWCIDPNDLVVAAQTDPDGSSITPPSSTTTTGSGYQIVIIDFPTGSFDVYDETGNVVANKMTNVIDDIVMDMHNIPPEGKENSVLLHCLSQQEHAVILTTLSLSLSRFVSPLLPPDVTNVHMVYSHAHMDHVGGATWVFDHVVATYTQAQVDIISSVYVQHEFQERIDAEFYSHRAPLPMVTVEDYMEVTFADHPSGHYDFSLTVESGHSEEKDLVVFFEKVSEDAPAIMFFVDVVFPGWAPFFSFAITQDIFDFIHIHDRLLAYPLGDDGYFIGGHIAKIGGKSDIETSKAFTNAVMAGAALGLSTVQLPPIIGATGVYDPTTTNYGNVWLLYDEYFKAVIKVCAKEVVAEFGCKLGGLDIVIDSHCRSAQSYWRVDF